MAKYELTKDDIKFVDNLIKIVRYRENVYVELCDLEVCNIKDQYIIDNIYEQLDYAFAKEKEIMGYLKENDNRINAIVEYISNKYDYHDSPTDDVCVSTMDISNRDIKRALALLNDKRIKIDNNSNENFLDKMLNNSLILKSAVDLDYYLGYLYFIQEYIDDQMDLSVRRKLIQCKYNLYFLNPKLEETMYDDKFNVNNRLYQSSKMVADYLGISDEAYYDLIHIEGFESGNENINNIANLKEEELHKDAVGILSFSAFIKSSLLMLDNTGISLLKERSKEKINNLSQEDYLKIDILHRTFDTIEENRSKSMRISLRGS